MTPILTACVGTNAELLPKVFELYVKPGAEIADVTYGKGVFWRNIDKSKYTVYESDLAGDPSVDFRETGYADASIDVLILDPPYMHNSKTAMKFDRLEFYGNNNGYHASIVRLYAGGIIEAARVLKKKGKILIKCQDEQESDKQKWLHEEVGCLLDLFGFKRLDLFVLVQDSIPAMRHDYQKSARKNHSYLIVAEFRR